MRPYIIILVIFSFTQAAFGQDHHRIDTLKRELAVYTDSIPEYKSKVDISVSNTSLKEFLRAVAATHDLNLSLDRIPNYQITNNFENVTVEELIVFVCYSYHLDVKMLNNILILYPHDRPDYVSFEYNKASDLLSFHLVADTLKHVAKEISDSTHYNIVLSQDARNLIVHGFIEELPFREAMKQLAVSNELEIKESSTGVFFVSPIIYEEELAPVETNTRTQGNASANNTRRSTRRSRTSSASSGSGSEDFEFSRSPSDSQKLKISASGTSIVEAIKSVSKELSIGYFFLEEPKGNLDCYLVDVSFEDFLTISLSSAQPEFTFSKTNGIYMIGTPKNANMYEAQVFTFKNRSVEKVIESIPKAITTDLEIIEYPDLNSLIMTGSESRMNRLADFLTQIDKPVANVLIEVMVVIINRGASLDAGISLGVSDSTATSTSGNLLPDLAMQLGSGSLNNFLGALDKGGVINLGRVTPNFYASIEALEQDNFLDLQSTPKLSTLNGHEASLIIGNSVYYLVQTQNVTGGVNPIITTTPRYEKVEANLELKILPFVSYNEDVTLTIDFESSDFIDPTVEGAPPGNSTRQFQSKIRIKNEEMIVVGGLEQESSSQNNRGLPGIAKVPGLRWLFGKNSKSNTQNKLLVFIKPTIVY